MTSAHGRSRARRIAPLFLALLLPIATACGVAVSDATPTGTATTAPPTATAAPSTPTPDASLLDDGGIRIIEVAYVRLLDEYITPIDPSRILDGAWAKLSAVAGEEGLDLPAQPAFADDRVADFDLFRLAYVPLAAQSEDATKLRQAAIRGMTESLQDCHTYFLSPVSTTSLSDARANRGVVGIGVDLAGVPPLVTEVITGSPAQKGGMLVGDRILEINGEDAGNFGPASAFERLNGDEDTSVDLLVQRYETGEVLELNMTRGRVNPPIVEGHVLDSGIGYVRIRNFPDGGVAENLRETLEGFEALGVPSWIIDMRGNGGGQMDVPAMSLFLPKDTVLVKDTNRSGDINQFTAIEGMLANVRPTVILTNNRTGSVAEVFVAALQEHGVAYVVGGNTNGCVGYTNIQPLGDGSSLAVTTHHNIGPVTGTVLAGLGVAPDETVTRTEDDIANLRDPQLDAAVAHLEPAVATP
jgi:C-terminal peptidase prc